MESTEQLIIHKNLWKLIESNIYLKRNAYLAMKLNSHGKQIPVEHEIRKYEPLPVMFMSS